MNMKTISKSVIASGIALILLGSCEKTLFIDVSETEPKIVMNGILSQSSGMWLNVSESVGTSTPVMNSFVPIEDAIVSVFHQGQLVLSVNENTNGNYYSTGFSPLPGETYDIRAHVNGMPDASASVTIPHFVEFSDYELTTALVSQNYYNQVLYNEVDFFLNFTLPDPPDTANYYMLGVYYLENDQYHPLSIDTEDLIMNIHILDAVDILAWDDHSMDGQTRDFDVRFRGQNYEGFETRILIALYSIEEAYFKYLKTYSQNFTVLNEGGLLYEPVQVSSNVDGGYGIVSAVASSYVLIDYTF